MGVLLNKSVIPDDTILKETLGITFLLWLELRETLRKEFVPASEEWKFYSAKSDWTLKFLFKKRNLFFFSPFHDYFMITFIFGKKGEEQVLKSHVDDKIKNDLSNAVKYAEGKGVSIEVRTGKNVLDILELVKIKIRS